MRGALLVGGTLPDALESVVIAVKKFKGSTSVTFYGLSNGLRCPLGSCLPALGSESSRFTRWVITVEAPSICTIPLYLFLTRLVL